jgi:hypothetical protein
VCVCVCERERERERERESLYTQLRNSPLALVDSECAVQIAYRWIPMYMHNVCVCVFVY